eukprot:5904920-Pleurochrysis_carterae.AAC.3
MSAMRAHYCVKCIKEVCTTRGRGCIEYAADHETNYILVQQAYGHHTITSTKNDDARDIATRRAGDVLNPYRPRRNVSTSQLNTILLSKRREWAAEWARSDKALPKLYKMHAATRTCSFLELSACMKTARLNNTLDCSGNLVSVNIAFANAGFAKCPGGSARRTFDKS